MNFRQATQPCYADSRFQRWNRLAAQNGPPGNACNFGSILVFFGFWDDSDRGKMAFVYVWLGMDQESS